MTIEVQRFTQDFEKEWDYFVDRANNGTLFHLRKFLNYHIPGRFTDASLIFTRNRQPLALLPAAVHQFNGERVYFSHPGASYGGLVVSDTVGLKETFEIAKMIILHAGKLDCGRIIITLPPYYLYKRYNSYVDFSLQQAGFFYRVRELSSVLHLDRTPEEFSMGFPDGVKRAIRKAEKSGLHVCLSKDIKSYYSILKKNLEMRHNVTPTHSQGELELLFSLFPGQIELYAAEYREEMIGGIVTFGCNKRVNLAFYIAHNHEFQNYRPVDCIIWHVIRESINRGFSFLDFGTFTLHKEPNWGLCRFKEKFGARGVFRDTLEYRISN